MNNNKLMQDIKEKVSTVGETVAYQLNSSHSWSDTESSRCSKCGDKDWMADEFCLGSLINKDKS
tara:strand:- start:2241 stop:2432 length:192 start_codon:yes stop_codon:yes gene_type:complete